MMMSSHAARKNPPEPHAGSQMRVSCLDWITSSSEQFVPVCPCGTTVGPVGFHDLGLVGRRAGQSTVDP